MSFKRLIFSFGALALALVAAPQAQAQTCTTTADCHQGFVCVMNIAPPPSTPAPQPAPDPTTAAKVSALVAPQSGYCEAAPCAADSECGPNMVCHTETYSQCTGGAAVAPCAPNTDCLPTKVAPPTCTDMKVSRCAFPWQLPCNTDTECGAGFMCTPTVSGSCSGSGGTGTGTATPGTAGPATSGGSAPSTGATAPATDIAVPDPVVPPDGTCTTTTTFPGWCQPKATTCASNTDCPMDWTCVSLPTRDQPVATTSMTGAAGTSGTSTPGAGVPADAFVPPTTTPVPAAMVCSSPYAYGGGLYGVKGQDSGGATGTPTSVGGTGAAGSGGNVPPATPTPTHENAGPGSGTSPSSGCAVGGGSPSVAFAALALLGLALARRRK